MNRPQPEECPEWAQNYIKHVQGDLIELLVQQTDTWPEQLENMQERADYAYAPGKWTVKEMAGHVIDTERILVYRLTAFARAEKAALPGFEEDDYVKNARFNERTLQSLGEEFALLRKANLYLFRSLNEQELDRIGAASGRRISVRAILHVIAGHVSHHSQILKERYL
jgi:hypothetical protein